MRTTKDVWDFCNEFTFYDHRSIDQVIGLNYVRTYTIKVSSENDSKPEDNRIRVKFTLDDNSLKVIDEDVKNNKHELSNLRLAIL